MQNRKSNCESAHQIESLLFDLNVVRRCKFNLSKRLNTKTTLKGFSNILLSFLTVFSSIYLLASPQLNSDSVRVVSIIVVGASILNIIISIENSTPASTIRSLEAHLCGQKITEIFRELKFGSIDYKTANTRYATVMSSHKDNHGSCDHHLALWSLRREHPTKTKQANFFNGPAHYFTSQFLPIITMLSGCALIVAIMLALNWYLAG